VTAGDRVFGFSAEGWGMRLPGMATGAAETRARHVGTAPAIVSGVDPTTITNAYHLTWNAGTDHADRTLTNGDAILRNDFVANCGQPARACRRSSIPCAAASAPSSSGAVDAPVHTLTVNGSPPALASAVRPTSAANTALG
jgi:hypothetical protein